MSNESIKQKILDGMWNAKSEFTKQDDFDTACIVVEKSFDSISQSGSYQCFHCLQNTVVWESDFDFEDYGYEGQGIVHVCHCSSCGAEIEYKVPIDDDVK